MEAALNLDNILSILSQHQGTIQLLITLAIVVERVSEVVISYMEKAIKGSRVEEYLNDSLTKQLITMLISIAVVFSVEIVLIPNLGVNFIVNKILAGLVISLGSNVMHDLLKMLTEIKGILTISKDIKLKYKNEK